MTAGPRPAAVAERPGGGGGEGVIEVEAVTRSYVLGGEGRRRGEERPVVHALRGVSFTIATNSPRAIVGPGCSIAENATVSGSVMLSGCTVGAGASLDGAILSPEAVVVPGAELEAGSVVGAGARAG